MKLKYQQWNQDGLNEDPHQNGTAFPEQRLGPLPPSLYLEQCVEVARKGGGQPRKLVTLEPSVDLTGYQLGQQRPTGTWADSVYL